MTIEEVIQLTGASTLLLAATDTLSDSAPWLPIIRELGSFGLIAFIVYWYATKIAPKAQAEFLEAIDKQQTAYIAAAKEAREQFLADHREDREQLKTLAASIDQLVLHCARKSNQLP